MEAQRLSADFREQFRAVIEAASPADLTQMWSDSHRRTEFYARTLMPELAVRMEMGVASEVLRVDYTLVEKASGVPLVVVESENEAFRAQEELWKLCCLSAPLRVLLTVVQWDDTPGVWEGGGWRSRLLHNWGCTVKAHAAVFPVPSLLLVLVGEWRANALRYHLASFSLTSGELVEEGLLVERLLSDAST